VRRLRRIATSAALLVLVACTGDDEAGRAPSTTAPVTAPSSASASSATDAVGEMTGAEFELWLRQKLSLPPLPSFSVPLDAFVDAEDRALAEDLEIPPGLYEGIAVVDARCAPGANDAVAADASNDFRGNDGSGVFREGDVEIVVEGDGSGSFTDGARTITIESDGSGSYTGGGLSVEIESDGSGLYDDGRRRMEVDSDRSGSYADADIEVTASGTGSGTYRDARRTVEVSPGGGVESTGDRALAEVVARVLADGLPLFPPVPHVGPVPEPVSGTSCGSVIRLDANVLFDFDADTLRPEAGALLDRVASLLVSLGSPPLRVDGHTDSIGSEAYNLDLSTRRAATVRDALATRGVAAGSIETQGFGESRPLAPNETVDGADDPAGRQLNRRVELVLRDEAG
jgi:OOP family OmpA-OmpF porin